MVCTPEHPKDRGSVGNAFCKHKLQLAEHQVPVLTTGIPILLYPLGCEIEHPSQRIVIGKTRLVFGDLPELPVQSLNNVCRVGGAMYLVDNTALQTAVWIHRLDCFHHATQSICSSTSSPASPPCRRSMKSCKRRKKAFTPIMAS